MGKCETFPYSFATQDSQKIYKQNESFIKNLKFMRNRRSNSKNRSQSLIYFDSLIPLFSYTAWNNAHATLIISKLFYDSFSFNFSAFSHPNSVTQRKFFFLQFPESVRHFSELAVVPKNWETS